MKKTWLTLCLGVGLLPAAFAQRTFSSSTPDPAKKNETTIIVTETSANQQFGSAPTDYRTQLKFNPIYLANGDMVFLAERVLKNRMTGEIGLGITYEDYVKDLFDPNKDDTDYDPVTYEHSMGYSVSGALKYYVSRNYPVLEGYYIGPEIRHRQYNMVAIKCLDEEISVPQKQLITDFKLMAGYTEYFDDNIFWEVFGGLGIRNRYYQNFVEGEEVEYYDDQGYMHLKTQVNITSPSKMVPTLNIGAKVGFAF